MLKRLKEDKHGVPCIWNEEKDEEILFEEAEKIWDEKLDTMIAGFEAAKRIQDGDYPIKEYIKYYKKDEEIFKKGMKVFTDNFFSLWD